MLARDSFLRSSKAAGSEEQAEVEQKLAINENPSNWTKCAQCAASANVPLQCAVIKKQHGLQVACNI